MDIQFYGGDCIVLANKEARLVVDDDLTELGLKSVTKPGDIALFTGEHGAPKAELKLLVDQPGEYEVSNLSIAGIAAQAHLDTSDTKRATMYKVTANEVSYLFVGHIYPELSSEQLEAIGMVDVMFVPVGGNGYTLDPVGALQVIKQVEPKLVIPTHYADKAITYPMPQQSLDDALKGLGMEVKERVPKLRVKPGELTDTTQLVVLERAG